MHFAVPKETENGETRVSLIPETAKRLVGKKHQVSIEAGAGTSAFYLDSEYEKAGCKIVSNKQELYANSDCILKVQPPTLSEVEEMPEGKALISFLWHKRNPEIVDVLKKKKLTGFSMDAIPRISRAQSMDALSSMATVAGYKAVLLAADHMAKFFPMLTTAAGTIRPAQGFILGAGVAGLQAIATARRLGAVVYAFDPRPATREQVESLGAKFIEIGMDAEGAEDSGGYAKEQSDAYLKKEQTVIAEKAKTMNFIVSTAMIPGKPAPKLITKEAVFGMAPGSVILDLAAEGGGNCEFTKPDETVVENNVTILGPTNLPAQMPLDASRMYSQNVATLIGQIIDENGLKNDWEDEIYKETCITK